MDKKTVCKKDLIHNLSWLKIEDIVKFDRIIKRIDDCDLPMA